jgi:hypothetical protein
MTAANWTAEQLDRIGGAEELEIAPQAARRLVAPAAADQRRSGR